MSLLLTLNRFQTLFRCFHCWLWTSKWPLIDKFFRHGKGLSGEKAECNVWISDCESQIKCCGSWVEVSFISGMLFLRLEGIIFNQKDNDLLYFVSIDFFFKCSKTSWTRLNPSKLLKCLKLLKLLRLLPISKNFVDIVRTEHL